MKQDMLPQAVKSTVDVVSMQAPFGGLHHTQSANGNTLYEAMNVMPLEDGTLAVRPKRRLLQGAMQIAAVQGMGINGCLLLAQGGLISRFKNGGDGLAFQGRASGDKHFVSFGSYTFIFPDQIVYYRDTDRFEPWELRISNDIAFFEYNTITLSGERSWEELGFRVGDGVTVTVSEHPSFNGPCKLLALSGRQATVNRVYVNETEDLYPVTVSRRMPDMIHVCAVGDRLVGCDRDKVYVSEAGNPFNWVSAGGLGDHAPVTLPLGGRGGFTACAAWEGYAVFFKENQIYRLMGHGAGSYALSDMTAPGVAQSGARTLCSLGGALYYLSPMGVCRYEGDHPTLIGGPLGHTLANGCGGTDGRHYYLWTRDEGGNARAYLYDPLTESWYEQDSVDAVAAATYGDRLIVVNQQGEIWLMGKVQDTVTRGTEEEGTVSALVEFGAEVCRFPRGRRLKGLAVLAEGAADATMRIAVCYDDQPVIWQTPEQRGWGNRRLLEFSLLPRDCDFFRLRLELRGAWAVSAVYEIFERTDGYA